MGGLLALAAPNGRFYYAQKVDTNRLMWDFVTNVEASTVDGHTGYEDPLANSLTTASRFT